MKGEEIINLMAKGFELRSGLFGAWLVNPIDFRCINVHNGAAKALVRKKLIVRDAGKWRIRIPIDIHFRPSSEDRSACGIVSPAKAAYDGRDVTCEKCKRSPRWLAYMGKI